VFPASDSARNMNAFVKEYLSQAYAELVIKKRSKDVVIDGASQRFSVFTDNGEYSAFPWAVCTARLSYPRDRFDRVGFEIARSLA